MERATEDHQDRPDHRCRATSFPQFFQQHEQPHESLLAAPKNPLITRTVWRKIAQPKATRREKFSLVGCVPRYSTPAGVARIKCNGIRGNPSTGAQDMLRPRPPTPGFRCATSGLRHFHFFILACAVPAARLRGITSSASRR